ncbi:hypothetical protein SAMN05443144_113110 [Fodinibius roseus]|uniref:Uncharacterized protein n=1 Tax=Fodinibius roseus TaxID=1194090 RepID=A0A1M5EN76_9BACT|nr:hypothetical protein SAMN05443144_113110 [Fodinibius roseus]
MSHLDKTTVLQRPLRYNTTLRVYGILRVFLLNRLYCAAPFSFTMVAMPKLFAMSNKLPEFYLNHITGFINRSKKLRDIGIGPYRLVDDLVGKAVFNML